MNRKERYEKVLGYFRENVGEVTTELMFGSAFQLLCATLLSAQCTDKRINEITPGLFRVFPDAQTMAKAEVKMFLSWSRAFPIPTPRQGTWWRWPGC